MIYDLKHKSRRRQVPLFASSILRRRYAIGLRTVTLGVHKWTHRRRMMRMESFASLVLRFASAGVPVASSRAVSDDPRQRAD